MRRAAKDDDRGQRPGAGPGASCCKDPVGHMAGSPNVRLRLSNRAENVLLVRQALSGLGGGGRRSIPSR